MEPLKSAIAALTAAQARGIDAVDPNAVSDAALRVVHELAIVAEGQQAAIVAQAGAIGELLARVRLLEPNPERDLEQVRELAKAGAPLIVVPPAPSEIITPDTPASATTAPASEPPTPVAAETDQAPPAP